MVPKLCRMGIGSWQRRKRKNTVFQFHHFDKLNRKRRRQGWEEYGGGGEGVRVDGGG